MALKYYHKGYRIINPQGSEEWEYALQLHKNQNGKHYDIRLAKPGEGVAYSWSTKKLPGISKKPVPAYRTPDHKLENLDFQGPIVTRKGYGTVKQLQRGKVILNKIDEKGIEFNFGKKKFRLRPFKGKRYLFEELS